ncbi:MAG: alcohol dehydrogenase catalytic domain-containing protein [Candidatus Eremiobacteraeota bacterium]|nr:alcohol dehydrogenase catalytic domain-containing protein [Candidatus Eremiobacteraeota bacterium]
MNVTAVPATMRAAVLYDAGDIRLEDRPVPDLAPGDILVRMEASGVCSGDLVAWYVRRKAPFVFGHEPAGTVVKVTARSDEPLLGARVFAHHHAPCLSCARCARGQYVQCTEWRRTSLDPGGMAEFFRVPLDNRAEVLRLPDDLSFVAGALIEPLACVVKSLRRASGAPLRFRDGSLEPSLRGSTVYVVGLGIMGLMHVALARALGAAVFGSDFLLARRELATRWGATAFEPDGALQSVLEASAGSGADVVVCGPGTPAALQHAISAAGGGGTVVMFAPFAPHERLALDQSDLYFRDLRLTGSYSSGPDDTACALEIVANGVVKPQMLGVVTWPLSDVACGYAAMQNQEIVKAVIVPSL